MRLARAALAVVLFLAAGLAGGAERRPLRVALAMTSDQESPFTRAVKRGIFFAARRLLETERLKIDFRHYDTGQSAEQTAQVVRQVIGDRPDFIIGDINASQTVVGARIAEAARQVYVTTTGASEEITLGRKFVFRTCYSDAYYGRVMSEYLMKEGPRSFLVVYDASRLYGASEKAVLVDAFNGKGRVLGTQALNRLTSSYDEHVAEVGRLAPDVVFLGTEQTQTLLYLAKLRGARASSLTVIGTSRLANEGIQAALRKLNVAFPVLWLANSPLDLTLGARFGDVARAYKELHGETMNALAAVGFDTLMLFAEAVKGLDGDFSQEELAERLRVLPPYDGLAATFHFGGRQDVSKTVYLRRREPEGTIRTLVVPPVLPGRPFEFLPE